MENKEKMYQTVAGDWLNEKEYNEYKRRIWEEEKAIVRTEHTVEEEAYRRGYLHGFVAGRCTKTSYEEARAWRYSDEQTYPPGTGMAGKKYGKEKTEIDPAFSAFSL